MQSDEPLWLTIAAIALAVLPLAWMARQWLKEWRDYRAGTLLPRGYRPPEPPTLREPWRWRFLWLYAAQAVAIGWPTIAMSSAVGWENAGVYLAMNTIIVAFATACLARAWDRSAAGLRRSRRAPGQRQQPPGEQGGALRPGARLHQRP